MSELHLYTVGKRSTTHCWGQKCYPKNSKAITVLLRGAKGTLERGNRLRRPFRVCRRLCSR